MVSAAARPAVAAERLLVLQKNAELLSGFDPETGDRSGSAIRVFAVPHEMAATADGAQLFITNYGVKSFHDADRGSNMVTIVDAHRVAHVGSVDLGENHRPHGIARGRSGRFYVTTDQPAALLVIDPVKRAVVARYPLGQKLPHMVVVTADERRAMVANAGSGTVTMVPLDGARAPDQAALRHIAIGGTPMGMALSPDGHWLFATNRDGDQVVRIDMGRLRVDGRIPVPGQPTRLAFAGDGRILVASAIAGDAVVAIDTTTSKEIARIAVGHRPEAVLLDDEHRRGFVSVQDDDKVVEFSTVDWKVIREIRTSDHPDALWLDRAPAASDARAEEIDGTATALLAPERLARLPPSDREAWARYLEASARQRARDQAVIAAELRATAKPRMVPAPYRKVFRFEPSMSPAWMTGDEGRRMTASVLSFQTPSGGWSKHVDMQGRPRQPGESFFSETDGWQYIATLDNDSTTEEIRFVAAAFAATSDPRVRAAFSRGFDYLLTAQFPNGCWPQVFPLQGGYHDAATFNDDAIVNVMRLLDDVSAGRVAAATPDQARRAGVAAGRGLTCILASQVVEGGLRTVWGQQADPLTLEPVAARRYELPGLAGREGASVTAYLMSLPSPSPGVVASVHAAVAWFQAHAITGYEYDVKNGLRKAAGAGPIWARLTELGSGKPIFSNRDGAKLYDWNQLTDRRFGYTWYCREPSEVLAGYAAWSGRHPRAPKKTAP